MAKAACWLVLTCILLFIAGHEGLRLAGSGSAGPSDLLEEWARTYLYVRDDIRIEYQSTIVTRALDDYQRGTANFLGNDRADEVDFGHLVQFPLFAQPMVVIYYVPGFSYSGPTLVLDGETLGLIWAGEITQWNDSRIQDLNGPAPLPNSTILLGYNENNRLSSAQVFKEALSRFSPTFREALAAANGSFAGLPPALAGNAFEVGEEAYQRLDWLQNTPNTMTFVRQAEADGYGQRYFYMVNKAGNLVEPGVDTVKAAISSFASNISAGQLSIDISDAPDANAWPLAYLNYIAFNRSTTDLDCSTVQELLRFIAWTLVNEEASKVAEEVYRWASIDPSLRKRVLDLFGQVQCNNEAAAETLYLIGTGPDMPIWATWSVEYSTTEASFKYFASSSQQSKQQLSTFDADFGTTNNGLKQEDARGKRSSDDVTLLPVNAYALVPVYFIPGLTGLVLDFATIAGIYMGEVVMWNDPRIVAQNTPEVVALLPEETIRVVIPTAPSDVTLQFTTLLNATIPAFADAVGAGSVVDFPVASSRDAVIVDNQESIPNALVITIYGFTFLEQPEAQLLLDMGQASLRKLDGSVVNSSLATVQSAVAGYLATEPNPTFSSIVLSPGNGSWPLVTFGSIIYHSSAMEDCNKAQALVSWLYWTQTNIRASRAAQKQGFLVASEADPSLRRRMLNQIKAFTCGGVPMSALAGCINDGDVCSGGQGTCIEGGCVCNSGWTGEFCERAIDTSSSDTTVTIVLAVVIPLAVLLLIVGACVVAAILLTRRMNRRHDDWEIDFDELEVGELLGSGGYGEVRKAMWKGTEVAVKVIAAEKITKEMASGFQDEVRVMTALRHPNVVLFMAACTKAPKMCIVMELMALGSLYDLLHNELVPDIPFVLKGKMAYQAAKGMHFLHSSGIVHRDLKSLNLLLDAKWNVKVSDFGLTKLKEDVGRGANKDARGTLHWTAPEVLNESEAVDWILADVYSFGIILPAAVAVAVIRDGIRPPLPDEDENTCPADYRMLITSCWHSDPVIRPTFLEIMTRLSAMPGDSSSRLGSSSMHSSSSSESYKSAALSVADNDGGSSSSSGSRGSAHMAAVTAPTAVRPPEGEVAIVFTDITRAASLWVHDAAAMRDATIVHNATLRAALARHRGYEALFLRDRNSGAGSFCMAFSRAADALAWCRDVQVALLKADWPEALLDHPGAAEELGDADDSRVLYRGLRVRMGIHFGEVTLVRDPTTRRVEYIGPVINTAARITAMTHGGQIVMSHAAFQELSSSADGASSEQARSLVCLGRFEMADASHDEWKLYEARVEGLEGRFFGGVTSDGGASSSTGGSSEGGSSGSSGGGGHGHHRLMQTAVGEGLHFAEDAFLTSANLCRWIIDHNEIRMGAQVGLGSYGVVYRGTWKGVDVAVKQFIKQKLDERRMLEFRAEMAMLSELHHPNIVLFIGACVKSPNLCIVTEFMTQGSLRDLLANPTVKLTWRQKMRMLRGAAVGINYLHSLRPVIVHRDLKPANLLVDEGGNVKVADFGFARIKEENATMTRCGTPCWTAPEVIRGEKYDERADIFSFGVIMWEVLTRKQPFAGRNFMGVSLGVLEGQRPAIPADCPAEFRKLMKKCWHAKADKRPTMDVVLAYLDREATGNSDPAV